MVVWQVYKFLPEVLYIYDVTYYKWIYKLIINEVLKNVMYKIIMGCYIVTALVLVTACNDNLDIQQAYPFSIETLPIPKRLKVGETAEMRC